MGSAFSSEHLRVRVRMIAFHVQEMWREKDMSKTIRKVFLNLTTCGLLGWNQVALGSSGSTENEFLDMNLSQLMDITITSVSKKPQHLSEAAAAIYVISNEDIKRSGVTSIPEALAMAPGLQVARISSSKWSISSRGFAGFTSNKLLVLIDGRSVYSPAYSGTFWDMQNTFLEDVDRIEVIRGPGGTLWGANAVNGVINIITKKASETQGGVMMAGVGDQEKFQSGGRYGAQLSDSIYGRFSLNYNDRDSNVRTDDNQDGGDSWQHVQGSFRVDGELQTKSRWTLQGDLYKNEIDQTLFPYWTETPPYLTAKDDVADVRGGNILGRFHHQISSEDNITIQAYYDYSDREEDYYQQTFDTIDLDLQYQTVIAELNSVSMGAGYRRTNGDFRDSYQIMLPDRTDDLFSAFLQDEIKIIDDKLWFTIGTKWEENDYTGTEWQPSARILYKPKPNHSVWTAVARAVRTPSMVESGGKVTLASFPSEFGTMRSSVVGSEDFTSEILIAYEAGYRFQNNHNFSLDLTAFYNDYEDLYNIHPSASATGIDYVFVNAGSGSGEGVEVAADWKPTTNVTFELTYSYLNMKFTADDTPGSTTTVATDFIASASPQNMASARGSIDFLQNWQCNLWLRYVDKITTRNSVNLLDETRELEDYILLDINLVWKPTKNIEIMLAGQNILEDEQLQYASEYVTPATSIERSFYGKITWRF